jgi:hypothetical protein
VGEEDFLLLLDERQAADSRADAHADALLVAAIVVETRIGHRLDRRHEAVVNECIVAARFFRRQVFADVEILHFGGDARGERRGVEARDRPDARARASDRLPRRGDADADGRDDPQSGDDDATAGHGDETLFGTAARAEPVRIRVAPTRRAPLRTRRIADGSLVAAAVSEVTS